MSSDIVIPKHTDPVLESFSSRELRVELVRSLSLSVEHLTRAAYIVRVLEERGEAVEDEANKSLVGWLRRIAYGQLAPEAVIRFAGKPGLINQVAALPLPDQRRVASGQPVPLVVRRENHTFDTRLVDPLYLNPSQFLQVFARDRIRDEAEQIAFLESVGVKKDPVNPLKFGRVRADRARGGLVIGKTFVPAGDVISALAAIHPGLPPDEQEETVTLAVKVSPAEHKRFKMSCVKAGISQQLLLYRAIVASGLLAPIEGE